MLRTKRHRIVAVNMSEADFGGVFESAISLSPRLKRSHFYGTCCCSSPLRSLSLCLSVSDFYFFLLFCILNFIYYAYYVVLRPAFSLFFWESRKEELIRDWNEMLCFSFSIFYFLFFIIYFCFWFLWKVYLLFLKKCKLQWALTLQSLNILCISNNYIVY